MNITSHYDPYGPYTLSQGRAFIKHNYVPFDLGSLELEEVIKNKLKVLAEDLIKWEELQKENRKRMKKHVPPAAEIAI